jgi:hypothetical protein
MAVGQRRKHHELLLPYNETDHGFVYAEESSWKCLQHSPSYRYGLITYPYHQLCPDQPTRSFHIFNSNVHHRRLDHRTNNPLCRQNENYCITELGIATVYVCSDKVDGTDMLSSHIGSSVNVKSERCFVRIWYIRNGFCINGVGQRRKHHELLLPYNETDHGFVYDDLQNITYKTKDRVTRSPLKKNGGEIMCSGRVSRKMTQINVPFLNFQASSTPRRVVENVYNIHRATDMAW